MRLFPAVKVAAILGALALCVAPTGATAVWQFNLAEMTQRAHKIYVGTVRSVTADTVAVGGGQLSILVYRLSVEEDLLGETALVKGARLAEIRMLGKQRQVRAGNLQSLNALPAMPEMAVGQSYLVFATAPSAIGLSTMVGLGQGCFKLYGQGDDRMAVNEANNAGLFRDMVLPAPSVAAARTYGPQAAAGPMPYAALRALVVNLLEAR